MDMKARLFLNLGLIYDGRGEVKKSAEYLKRAISIAERYRLYDDVYRCQFSLSGMYQRSGNISQALRSLDEAQKNAQKLKDKHLESDTLLQKAQLHISIGDYETAKHDLKKAKKLGFANVEDTKKLYKLYKSACKMKEACEDLETATDEKCRMKLYDTLADSSVEAGNLKQALEYYHKQMECAAILGLDDQEMVPIYVSLAQTYADVKEYREAVRYYKLELLCYTNNLEQACRTWLNIADAEEHLNLGYSKVSKSYLEAFEAARKTKHRKLQVQVLKSLAEVQKYFKQTEHLVITETKLDNLLKKYQSDVDDVSDEESQPMETNDEEMVISDISESEDEEDQVDSNISSTRRYPRNTILKTKRNEKGETPLHRACIEGNLKKVERLIEQGHPVNPRDHCGWIPLHEAANHDFYHIIEYLIEHGANINDRGGRLCGGVTPLIDAASCGNMDVITLLVDRGANILAKDDEGQTVLDRLVEWHERCEDTCCGELETQYIKTVKKLQSNTACVSRKHISVPTDALNSTCDDQYSDDGLPDLSFSSKKAKRQKYLAALKKTAKPLIVEDNEQDSDVGDSYDSQEIYRNSVLNDIETNNNSATDDYRKAISIVGISAQRLESQIPKSAQKRKSSDNIPDVALISENCYIDSDWLIDDVGPMKRKFIDHEGFTSGNSTRSNKSNGSKRQRINDFDICDTNDVNNVRDNLNISDEELVYIVDTSPETLPIISKSKPLKTLSFKRKPKQTRITNFGSSSERRESNRSSSRDNSRTNIRNIDSDSNSLEGVSNALDDLSSSINFSSNISSTPTSSLTSSSIVNQSVMRLKVRLKDKILLIPVLNSDKNNSISWLGQEVSQRYFSLYGLRPLLTLSTPEGAIFSPDDIISMVLVNNDELNGMIESWDLPPINQRYKQACKTLNTVVYGNICNVLLSSETTGQLELHSLALRPTQLEPVFRALQGQNSLTLLNLQGNRMGDCGVENLCKTFEAMQNLTSLNLGCNNISSIGMKHITDALQKPLNNPDSPKYLQLLNYLNLEKNSVGDNCIASLANLINCLPSLASLNISSCLLTSKCFLQNRILLANSLMGSSIQVLDVSNNKFGSLGVELLIKCLNSRTITKLNMAHTQSGTSQLSLHLQQYITQIGCSLEELNISGCNLSPDDLHFITRLPSSCSKLHKLSISKNIRITNQTIEQLLQQIVLNTDSCLDELIVEGCSIKSPLDTSFLDALSDILCRNYPLRYFSFTCENVDKVDSDCVRQVWEEKWKELSKICVCGNYIRLNTAEETL